MEFEINDFMREIRTGNQDRMDVAAGILCRHKDKEAVLPLISATYHENSVVRGIVAICLGVLGDARAVKALKRLKEIDEDRNVRLAAFLALKYFGKLTYEELKEELRKYESFPEDEVFPSKKKPARDKKRPSPFSRIPIVGHFPVYPREKQIFILGSIGILVLIFLSIAYWGRLNIHYKHSTMDIPVRTPSIGERLIERNNRIAKFKNENLDPDKPDGALPKTMLLSTHGDLLGELTEQVYDDPKFAKAGKTTLLASWRKMNYGHTRRDREDSLLHEISTNEKLIFPNISAMHMEYDLQEGTVAHQAIENSDPDIEITIIVDKVTVK